MLKKILIGCLFIISYLIWGTFTWGEHTYMLFLQLISSFVITFFTAREINFDKKVFVLLNAPLVIILLVGGIVANDFSRSSLYIIFNPVSSVLGYYFYKNRNALLPILAITGAMALSFYILPIAFSYHKNKDAVTDTRFPKVVLTNEDGKIITLSRDKIIVLDFWTTSCSICFTKFPDLQNVFEKYKNNPKVEIVAVNIPLRRDVFAETSKILNRLNYSFPQLYAKSEKQIIDSLNITSVPHVLILKNNRIRYHGMFETKENVKIYDIEEEIDRLLTE